MKTREGATMRTTLAAALFAAFAGAALAADASPESAQDSPYVVPFTTVHGFHSAVNGIDYSLYIRVPPEYATTTARYPVIYTLDADYQFMLATNITDHLSDRQGQSPKAIVVSIAYTGDYPDQDRYHLNRTRDYTPVFAPDGGYGPAFQKFSGGGPKFLAMIEREVFAYIDHTYRTDPADRTLVGHSYGGLFASWVLQTHPGLFKRYLIVSPSLWYKDKMILAAESTRHAPLASKTLVYLAVGSWENHTPNGYAMVDDMNRFAELLAARHDPNLVVRARTFEDETHASIYPVAFSTGIRHLFGDMDAAGAVGGD